MEGNRTKLYELDIENIKRIEALKDIHKNDRCFIIGTGPSLNKTPLNLIKNEILFGVNTLYNGFKKWDICPQYYAVGDPLTFDIHHKKILALDATLFIGDGGLDEYLKHTEYYSRLCKNPPLLIPNLGWMWSNENDFSKDLTKGAFNGDTILIDICLQSCFYMGFSEVYLIGMDLDYSKEHHFDGTIEKPLTPFPSHLGDFSFILKSLEVCKRVYEESNRIIYNSTVGGKLELFIRKSLEDIIK